MIGNSNLKTLGPRSAQLITALYDRRQSTFTAADAGEITGLAPAATRQLLQKARQRGLVTRLKPGLYNLVPFDLGRVAEHVDSPWLIAQRMAGEDAWFLSHASALELHRMATQPNFTVYTSCTRRIRPQSAGGYSFRFVELRQDQVFGVMKHWVDKERFVMVSDVERTIIDGLRHPAFVGGITEVAKGLWMKREQINLPRLVDYARRIEVGAVVRRLGYLLEHYGLADEATLDGLRAMLTATYQRLDPLFPAEGPFIARWRLQLNVTPEELDAVRLG